MQGPKITSRQCSSKHSRKRARSVASAQSTSKYSLQVPSRLASAMPLLTGAAVAALVGHAIQHVDGRDEAPALREGAEPLLVDRHHLRAPVELDQRPVHCEVKVGVAPLNHERVGLVGD